MDMYLIWEHEDIKETMLLGASSFGVFYADSGLDFLTDMINTSPELVKYARITTDSGLQYDIDGFLRLFEGKEGLKIKKRLDI